jgi:hypothetical protein
MASNYELKVILPPGAKDIQVYLIDYVVGLFAV